MSLLLCPCVLLAITVVVVILFGVFVAVVIVVEILPARNASDHRLVVVSKKEQTRSTCPCILAVTYQARNYGDVGLVKSRSQQKCCKAHYSCNKDVVRLEEIALSTMMSRGSKIALATKMSNLLSYDKIKFQIKFGRIMK